jgi:2-polyprenyl-3-methyl-5-hydroxy-6-metoxy-1,4-benzoquinol methylase
VSRDDVAAKYPTRFLRQYVRSKMAADPVYRAVLEHVRDGEPLLDVGCGVGILELFLRANGVRCPVTAIDSDVQKIAVAQSLGCDGVTFLAGDALALPPFRGTIVLLDLLHYFRAEEQQQILAAVIERTSGIVVIRDAVRDRSMRYRATLAEETFARAVRWLRVPRLEFPTIESVVSPFHAAGFESSVRSNWGQTPFNNFLFVFSRASSGMTKS